MCRTSNKTLPKHNELKQFIYDKTFEFLDNLFKLAIINLNSDINEKNKNNIIECFKQVKEFVLNNDKNENKMFSFKQDEEKVWDIADIKLKSYIYFNRYCKMIQALSKEYEKVEKEERKKIIDYYLFDNRLMELNTVGVSFYYDCKYEKVKTTLFRSDGGLCTWNKECCKNKTFVDTLKFIFNGCREHINKGNEKLKLRSYSKCLGIDLFKYVSIPKGKDNVILRIMENADINFIRYNSEMFSLQEFIQKDGQVNETVNFCIDISTPRDDNRDNLKIWMDRFLGKDSTEIQSFTSPVSDKEVIMSYTPTPNTVVKYSLDEKCTCMGKVIEWEFELNKEELICLLYQYYSKYSEIKLKNKCFESGFKSYMDKNFNSAINNENRESFQEFYEYIMKCIGDISNPIQKKIEKVLSFVRWENENIYIEKREKSIYKVESSDSYISWFKEVLQQCMKE